MTTKVIQLPCQRRLPSECIMFDMKYFIPSSYIYSKCKQKRYKEICKTIFKKRYTNHKNSSSLFKSKNDKALSTEYWTLIRLKWEIKRPYKAYNPTFNKCNLCLNEKLVITDNAEKNLLNKRSEVISKYYH